VSLFLWGENLAEEENQEDMSYDEITEYNDMRFDTLLQLLIGRKIITQEEFDKKLDEMFPDEE
jgi:hypothetical protein